MLLLPSFAIRMPPRLMLFAAEDAAFTVRLHSAVTLSQNRCLPCFACGNIHQLIVSSFFQHVIIVLVVIGCPV